MKNKLFVAVLTIFAAASIVGCGNVADSFDYAMKSAKEEYEWYNGIESTEVSSEDPAETTNETIHVGDSFVTDGFKITINNICNDGVSYDVFSTNTSFVRCDYTIENLSSSQKKLYIDAKAYKNNIMYEGSVYVLDRPEGEWLVELGGGRIFENHIYFENACASDTDTFEIEMNGHTIVWKDGSTPIENQTTENNEIELYTPEPGEHFEEGDGPSDFADKSIYIDIFGDLIWDVDYYALVDLQNDGQYEMVTMKFNESTQMYTDRVYEADANFMAREVGSLETTSPYLFFAVDQGRGFLVSDLYLCTTADGSEYLTETLYHVYDNNGFTVDIIYENEEVEDSYNNGHQVPYANGGDIEPMYDIR